MKAILFLMCLGFPHDAFAQADADGFFNVQPSGEVIRQPMALGHTEAAKRNQPRQIKVIYEGHAVARNQAPVIEESVQLKTEFEYSLGSKRVRADRVVFIPANMQDWVGLTKSQNGVALLGRIVAREPSLVKVEYLIVDTSRDEENILAPPVLSAPLGQKLQVNLDRGDARATLSFEASVRKL